MLTITIPGDELWDDENEVFRYTESTTLQFEHSLVSVSKWEARFHKLFLNGDKKTPEEMTGYIEAMLVTPDPPDNVFDLLTEEDVRKIDAYINDPMTGTTVSSFADGGRSSERISAELIYFWMSQYQIDKEHENWHINRLFTLIKVHHAKTQKPKKKSVSQIAAENAEINRRRREQLGTTG